MAISLNNIRQNLNSRSLGLISLGTLYWLLFAASSGMIEYYDHSLSGVLSEGVGHRITFIYYGNAHDFLQYSGIYWFPTNHVGITLPILQTILSVFLAVMVPLAVDDIMKIKRNGRIGRAGGLSLGGSILSLISTTGGCCSLPIIYYALALVASSSASFGVTLFFASYSYLIDAAVLIILGVLHVRNIRIIESLSRGTYLGGRIQFKNESPVLRKETK
ncbi:MAG: hypothetical protein ACP5UZ_06720 [Thermoplasmata archaeon]